MKVDCHCHILPEIDDGSWCLEVSADLARRQVAWGFERAVCTSHRTSLYRNTPDIVNRACDRLREALALREIPLELVPSMEYRLVPETWPETLEKGWLMPWEGNYLLIELPISDGSKIGDIVPADEVNRLLDMGCRGPSWRIRSATCTSPWKTTSASRKPAACSSVTPVPSKDSMARPSV